MDWLVDTVTSRVIAAVAVLLACGGFALARADSTHQPWLRQVKLYAELPTPPQYGFLRPDEDMYRHAGRSLASVRIRAKDGTEIPWRQWGSAKSPAAGPTEQLTQIRTGRVKQAIWATFDAGAAGIAHTAVELEVDGGTWASERGSFFGQVTLDGSNDQKRWATFAKGTIYSLTEPEGDGKGRIVESRRIVYQPLNYRYLRVTVPGVEKIRAAQVVPLAASGSPTPAAPIEFRTVAVHKSTVRSVKAATELVLDLGYANAPLDMIQVNTATAEFDRAFTVYVSNTRKGLNDDSALVRVGRIFRYPFAVSDGMAIDDLNADGRYLRLVVQNRAEKPLEAPGVNAIVRSRMLLFKLRGRSPYRVTYGWGLGAPGGGFAKGTATPSDAGIPVELSLTPERKNPAAQSRVVAYLTSPLAILGFACAIVGAVGWWWARRRERALVAEALAWLAAEEGDDPHDAA